MLPHLNVQSVKLAFMTSQDLSGSWLNEVNVVFSALCIIMIEVYVAFHCIILRFKREVSWIVVITLLDGQGFFLFLYWCIISLYPSLAYVNKTKVLM
jgi:hypothetical protein